MFGRGFESLQLHLKWKDLNPFNNKNTLYRWFRVFFISHHYPLIVVGCHFSGNKSGNKLKICPMKNWVFNFLSNLIINQRVIKYFHLLLSPFIKNKFNCQFMFLPEISLKTTRNMSLKFYLRKKSGNAKVNFRYRNGVQDNVLSTPFLLMLKDARF